MHVYLMRHAEAVSASDWLGSDQDRPLSPIGIAKFDEALKEMLRLKWPAIPVLVSPFVRARATADLLTQALKWPKARVENKLASGAYAEAIRQIIIDQKSSEPLLIIGHMPELAVFASRITLDAKLLDTGLLPGDIVAIETGDLSNWGQGKLLWWRKLSDWKKISA